MKFLRLPPWPTAPIKNTTAWNSTTAETPYEKEINICKILLIKCGQPKCQRGI
jgi:hypothetical protein